MTQDQQQRDHSHYFKDVSQLQTIDVYRVLELFGVTDPCLQHAAKKILCAGNRGIKALQKDVSEARDSLDRRLEMWAEEAPMPTTAAPTQDGADAPRPSEYQHFQPHELRVVDELQELQESMAKLERFLGQTQIVIAADEREMLIDQWNAMHKLSLVLQRRIAHWCARVESDLRKGKL